MKNILAKLFVRIQNPKVIVAVVSGVLLILSNTGIITVDKANHVSDLLNMFLSCFVGVGVFGNPESHVLPVVPVPAPVAPVPAPVAPAPNALPNGQATPTTPPPFYTGAV